MRQAQGVEPLRLRPLRQNIRLDALFLNQPQDRANNRCHRLLDLARCPRHRPYTPRRHPLNRLGPLDNLPARPQEPEEAPYDPTAFRRRPRKEDAPRSLPYHHRQPRKLARRVLDNLQPQHQTMDFRKVMPTGNCGLIIDTTIPNPHFPIPGGKSLHKKDSPHGRAARVMLSVLYRFPIARGRNLRGCYRKCTAMIAQTECYHAYGHRYHSSFSLASLTGRGVRVN